MTCCAPVSYTHLDVYKRQVVVRAAKAETVALAAAGSIQEWKSADKKAEVVSSVGLEGEIKQVEISAAGILTGLYYDCLLYTSRCV